MTTIFSEKILRPSEHCGLSNSFGCQLSELMVLSVNFGWALDQETQIVFDLTEIGASFYTNFECLMER